MLGQGNDPGDASIVKMVITALFGVIGVMGTFWSKVFFNLGAKNDQLEKDKDELEKQVSDLRTENALLKQTIESRQSSDKE